MIQSMRRARRKNTQDRVRIKEAKKLDRFNELLEISVDRLLDKINANETLEK